MRPVETLSAAAIMLMVLVSTLAEGSKFSSAVMPMGTVRVGRTKTVLAGTLWMAARMSSVAGFMV